MAEKGGTAPGAIRGGSSRLGEILLSAMPVKQMIEVTKIDILGDKGRPKYRPGLAVPGREGVVRAAFEHATAPGGLKIIEGRAGTGVGVHRLSARLRRDDLQRSGQDPRPYLSDAHAAMADGLELCGADAPARERQGVRGRGDGARRKPQ